ncbi:MAG: hypothetical protein DRP37_01765, partial [Thermodesulfobacteriota bacterium]
AFTGCRRCEATGTQTYSLYFKYPATKQMRCHVNATHRIVSVYRVPQMRGDGYADVLPVLQVPGNKADAVPCERLRNKKGKLAAYPLYKTMS